MSRAPSEAVQRAFVAPVAQIIRRVEVYEAGGEIPWKPHLWPSLLVGGTISADMSEEERRVIDCELDNSSGEIDPVPDGLWYDKVLKVFYGIILHDRDRDPRVAIIEEYQSAGQGLEIKTALAQAGVKTVLYDPLVVTYDEIADFDIIVSISSSYPRKTALLTEAFERGKSVLTIAPSATAAHLPLVLGSTGAETTPVGVRSFVKDDITDEIAVGWDGTWEMSAGLAYRPILAAAAGATVLARSFEGAGSLAIAVVMRLGLAGQGWIHVQQSRVDNAAFSNRRDDFLRFLGRAIGRLDYYVPEPMWECQIGEFISDTIEDADDFKDRIRFSGRDYTKLCMKSEFSKATMFTANQAIEDVISAIAHNCGIAKLRLSRTGELLGKDTTYERGTSRWKAMYDIAIANNCDLYFDAEGYLVLAMQQDPLTTPPNLVLTTGVGGNLVKSGRKTGDSSLFNHIVVVGESSDTTVPLVFAEVENNDPGSPSRISKIGRRTKQVSSPLVTTEAQALELARTMLSVAALEEHELTFGAVLMPWVEPGEIVEKEDDGSWGPSRYLISSLTFPLDLGPMSGTGKRVTRVG